MAYSAKKRWMLSGSAMALGLAGMTIVFWLGRNHTDPVSVGLFRAALAVIIVGLAVRSFSYMDEVQRQAAQKRWFQGSFFGIAVMLPVVVFLQTHAPWLDLVVQFFFHHSPTPRLYFSLGVGIPVMLQAASVLVLRLVDKLSQSSQS